MNPWKQNRSKPKLTDENFPTLQNSAHADDDNAVNDGVSEPNGFSSPSQAQDDEVEILRAIYMEDFQEVESVAAWTRSKQHAFKIKLKANSDSNVSIYLQVKFTEHYPKTLPVLDLENLDALREKSQSRLHRLLDKKLKEQTGDVMIYDLCTAIQDVLEDEVEQNLETEQLPSLEEERAVKEAKLLEEAKQREEDEMHKLENAKAEEDRKLKEMVDEELSRRKPSNRKSKQVIPLSSKDLCKDMRDDLFTFDQVSTINVEGNTVSFDTVTGLIEQTSGPLTRVYTANPVGELQRYPTVLCLKQVVIRDYSKENIEFKSTLLNFENELENLKKLQNGGIDNLIDFKIEKLSAETVDSYDQWRVTLLTNFASRGSLGDLLEMTDSISAQKIRSWYIDLLEALEFYHRNGIIHGNIHDHNILLHRSRANGVIRVQLADAVYQDRLKQIKSWKVPKTRYSRKVSTGWMAPELVISTHAPKTRKTDIWELGIILIQMIFGNKGAQKYESPVAVAEEENLSGPLEDFIRKIFNPNPSRRPSAFDLIPSEFLRTDVPLILEIAPIGGGTSAEGTTSFSSAGHMRRNSTIGFQSRYASEWIEAGRLGKGGYGEVWKARNKLDGRVYAIKKIVLYTPAMLTSTLSEVMLLSRLNHPYVVRYYTAWPEEETSSTSNTEQESSTMSGERSLEQEISLNAFTQDTGGLDFVSSSGYPKMDFDDESDGEYSDQNGLDRSRSSYCSNSNSIDPHRSNVLSLRKTISGQKPARAYRTTLYIQMDFCEKHTLRDLIRKDLYQDVEAIWRLFRQVLEGLSHIHSHKIIHRDLKPDNVFIDHASNVKIGDFGLATSDHNHATGHRGTNDYATADMTRSIGTALYVAPELRSNVTGIYGNKVDMYSLGIILFEMCYPLKTAMERDFVIRSLRESEHALPKDFNVSERGVLGEIIMSLIHHQPEVRPSSDELLQSGKIPSQVEDETVREALRSLFDSRSPYYLKIMSALFSQPSNKEVKDSIWDLTTLNDSHGTDINKMFLTSYVQKKLEKIFRRHGATEHNRYILYPRSVHYENRSVVQMLDPSGTLVQLPYDLTLPYAKMIAKTAPAAGKTFTIDRVFRATPSGAPQSSIEADFDIVSADTQDKALKEAEAIKVLDEIVCEFPSLAKAEMCFHLNHSDVLERILDFCNIHVSKRPNVKDVLSKLNIGNWTWQKIRNELRAPSVGIPSTSIDDLSNFDFRSSIRKGCAKLRTLFDDMVDHDKLDALFAHMDKVDNYAQLLGVRSPIYFSPLSSLNEKFYRGGVLFTCLFESSKREVLAAGGRYDALIEENRPIATGQFTGCRAVGISIGCDRLAASMARFQRTEEKNMHSRRRMESALHIWEAPRRCEILVASFDPDILRSTGVKLVADLWNYDLSAELAVDASSPDELTSYYKNDKHSWIIIIRHENSNTAGKPELKVRSMVRREDTDVRISDLLSYFRGEIRDRDQRELPQGRAKLQRQGSTAEAIDDDQNVKVCVRDQQRGRKFQKWMVVETARNQTRALLNSFASAPILVIDVKDDICEHIRKSRLSDKESWRGWIRAAQIAEMRDYFQYLHHTFEKYLKAWKDDDYNAALRMLPVYNVKTGACFLYDLGL